MSAILNVDFQKENDYVFPKLIILTTQKRPNFACDNYIFPKQGETRTSSGPIPPPLNTDKNEAMTVGTASRINQDFGF